MNLFTRNMVWYKAIRVSGHDPSMWRIDPKGRLIRWDAHGDRKDPHGWEIGHIIAKVEGGSDDLSNLQAEHYRTNLEKEEVRRFLAHMEMQRLLREARTSAPQPISFAEILIRSRLI